MAGQGTSAVEMLEERAELELVVIPIGGGGLIAGNAVAAKAIKQGIAVIGVEAALYPSMWNAIKGDRRPIGGPTLAEGIAVKTVGRSGLPLVAAVVAEIVLVAEAQLEGAVNAYAILQKTMAEGAGAAPLAALLAEPKRFRGKKVGLVLPGGNIDPRILATIMVRELEREDRIIAFRLTIPDQPGVLGHIASRLGELGANILEVEHKRLLLDVPAKGTQLDITVETRDRAHAQKVLAAFAAEGYAPQRIAAGVGMRGTRRHDHRIFARDLVDERRHAERFADAVQDIEIGQAGLDHDHVGALGNVELSLAQRLLRVRRIHLIGALVAGERRRGADRVAERTVEGRGVFRRIGHDRHVRERGRVQRGADGADPAVHHVGGRADVAAGLGLHQRLAHQHL